MAVYMLALELPMSPLADDSVPSRGCVAQQSLVHTVTTKHFPPTSNHVFLGVH